MFKRDYIIFYIYFMKCQYRNCIKEFKDKSNKKFCSRSCKSSESVYIFRERQKKLKNDINKGS